MKNLFLITILLTVAVGVAQAETISQSFNVNGGNLDMFDPALGTLDAVEMVLEMGWWGAPFGGIDVINDVHEWEFDPMLGNFVEVYPGLSGCAVYAEYKFTAQVVGITGATANVKSSFQSNPLILNPYQSVSISTGPISPKTASKDLSSLLGDFIGSGELTIGTSKSSQLYAEGNPFDSYSTPRCEWTMYNVPPQDYDYAGTLTYEYTPVPEPASLGLLTMGLLSLGGLSLLKRKR